MGAPPVLTGRCFWGRRAAPTGPLLYTAVTSRSDTPLSLVGNTYYERRFGKKATATTTAAGAAAAAAATTTLPPLCAGDVVVRMGSATPASLRNHRVVDVTGIQTSFLDASERNGRARLRVDDVVNSMHLHNGHEVPEVRRGAVAVGRLTVLCAFPLAGAASLVPLLNAAGTLLKRQSLTYHSEEEGVQLVRVLGENCRAAALQRVCLRPVTRGDCVVGVRLQ
ncbi:hypothetical protein DQ04_06531000 [Trypanosoma grayi]|uniref:hypothetical protein n=1 Tax=Trypanosoma grayi TaxID=71804 RepID=UPI0004F44C85|nr:hypothetical protein DQ04_06531000 [Trypanosoma grayi]KEG08740.1 hypothetical protein DQ04_06531000 [Trypanosoma grayi]